MTQPALLALEDGSIFQGISIGTEGQTIGEVVFNTSMTGYQEILTDPSYAKQIITLTYPHIGNVGVNLEDIESDRIWAAGLVIRDLPLAASSWRMHLSLAEYLANNKVVAIAGIDTRRLTRLLREKGALNGCIMTGNKIDEKRAFASALGFCGIKGANLVDEVTTPHRYEWTQGLWDVENGYQQPGSLKYHVVAYDFGIKRNILRALVHCGCRVTVVPAQTTPDEVFKLNPDGIFLSNGPGDPAACIEAIEMIKVYLQTDIPIFGICLGQQLLALACGAKTVKLKFGHHGANHPVQDVDTKKVMISCQNHGFAVDPETLPPTLEPTHISLFDGTLQGMRHTEKPVFAFQGHPEASPGPHDVYPLFQDFVDLMEKYQSQS